MVALAVYISPGWLFSSSMRVSTAVLWLLFCLVGVLQRRLWRALLAGMILLLGWEIAWQLVSWRISTDRPLSWSLLPFVASTAVVLGLQRIAIRPYLPLIALSLVIGTARVSTGFHVNGYSDLTLRSAGRGLQRGRQTAWGLAYLWPLWRARRVAPPPPVPTALPAPPLR